MGRQPINILYVLLSSFMFTLESKLEFLLEPNLREFGGFGCDLILLEEVFISMCFDIGFWKRSTARSKSRL